MKKSEQTLAGIALGSGRFQVGEPMKNAQKLPADISNGKIKSEEYFSIPCESLQSFREKEVFSPLDQSIFEELQRSILQVGVLQPILVREISEKNGTFEILSGEHRWKASVFVGNRHIPARILTDCDDIQAKSIYMLSNILTRELSLEDRILGWSQYYLAQKERAKAFKNLAELQNKGLLPSETASKSLSQRHILRFYHLSTLHPQLKLLVLDKKISLEKGESFSLFPAEEQEILAPFSEQIDGKTANIILQLQQGKLENRKFTKENLNYIFSEQFQTKNATSFTRVMEEAKSLLRKKLKKEEYGESSKILGDALDLYRECNGQAKLARKAIREYLRNHPDEEGFGADYGILEE